MKLAVWWHWLRRLQCPLAMIIFAAATLMPASYVTHATRDTNLHFAGNALLYFSAALAFYHRVPLAVLLALSLTDYQLGAVVTAFVGLDSFTPGVVAIARVGLGALTLAVIRHGRLPGSGASHT